jgi:hypothetical protein
MHGAEVTDKKPDDRQGWRPPTRRTFVAMLAAAAAALTVKQAVDPKPRPFGGKTLWIGHY